MIMYYELNKGEVLPPGVQVWGYRYRAHVETRNGRYCLGEFETVEQAEAAIKNAQAEQWNG